MKTRLFHDTFATLVAMAIAMLALPQEAEAQTDYGFKVAGVKVSSENSNDLSAIPGVSGTANYDPATKTLTLDNATIDAPSGKRGIYAEEDITVEVKGTCHVTSNDMEAVFLGNGTRMTVKGEGTLNAACTTDNESAVFIEPDATLTIDGCTLYAKGAHGICGQDGTSNETLIVKNANLTAEGMGMTISRLAVFTLDGCHIILPIGATFDTDQHAVCDQTGYITNQKVVIEKTPTAIEAATLASPHRHGIHILDGRRMGMPFGDLPKGIYVVNGRKVVKH